MAALDNKAGSDEEVGTPKVHDNDIPSLGAGKEAGETTGHSHAVAFTEEELVVEKKLRRKLDLVIMPLMIWT